MSDRNSYQQILRSSAIIGGASVINILSGLIRTKVAAVLLGPTGVGMIGLLQTLMATGSTIAALGFGTVGTRQIAEAAAQRNGGSMAAARRALFWGTTALAALGGGLFWLLREVLAVQVLGDPERSAQIGWLALGVALSVAATSQSALLNGLRRIGDLARISVASGLLSTVLGIAALLWLGETGLLIFVLAVPVSSYIFGLWFVSRLAEPEQATPTPLTDLFSQWHVMARLGFAFMITGVVAALGQLLLRALVQRELGAEALGQFQAALTISMTYIGFALGAMGADYYPRLTAAILDHTQVNRLVNEQTEVALLLAGPVLLAMLGLAPWVIELLYSRAFDQAVVILRWQVLGDVLKVASWPLGFITLAAGDGRTFMFIETFAICVFVLFVLVTLPLLDVYATGIGFLVMYIAYLPLAYWIGYIRTGFSWTRPVATLLGLFLASACAVFAVADLSRTAGAFCGVLLALVFGLYGATHLGAKANVGGRIGRISKSVRALMVKTGIIDE